MKLLLWHWGKRGAGPLIAVLLAEALRRNGHDAVLSLAEGAEILRAPAAPDCAWVEPTYETRLGYLWQALLSPWRGRTQRRLAGIAPDVAVCAMPALLDFRMVWALRRAGIPYGVIVHDAAAHPGERLSFRLLRQMRLLRGAAVLFPLSTHVQDGLLLQGYGNGGQKIVKLWHPPFDFGGKAAPPLAHGGRPRLLFFGRLLPYKGLDLLAAALALLGPDLPFTVRICGEGPNSDALSQLAAMKDVTVDRRWIPEAEIPALIAWADGIVLPYREASQSGVAAAALAEGRFVLATNVGGLPEQLEGVANALLCAPAPAEIAAGLARLFQLPQAVLAHESGGDWVAMAAEMAEALSHASA